MRFLFALLVVLAACTAPVAEPPPAAQVCGGIAGIGCGEGEYCQHATGECQYADGQGTCQPKLEVCTRDYRPVCGCNGKTYGNACTAASFGVSIDHDGACEPEAEAALSIQDENDEG